MQKQLVRGFVVGRNALDGVQTRLRNDEGEIGSWLILAAGLAIAAAAAVVALGPWLAGKVTAITSN